MSLFIKLYLDEDVSVLVANLLRARGFDVLTTLEAGNLQQDDAAQLDFAVSQQRALVTHNRADFERLYQDYIDTERQTWGVIIAVRRPPHQVAQRLLAILNAVTADEMQNQIRYI